MKSALGGLKTALGGVNTAFGGLKIAFGGLKTAFGGLGLNTAFGRHYPSNASQAYGLHTPSDAFPGRHLANAKTSSATWRKPMKLQLLLLILRLRQ